MLATYYCIRDLQGDIVDEGIIKDAEDIITPQQNTGITDLPSECEAHHFKVDGYTIETCLFTIKREDIKARKLTGVFTD